MKKAIALVLAGMTAFSLAACGSSSGSTAASGAASTTAAAASTEAAPAASRGGVHRCGSGSLDGNWQHGG